MTYDQLRFVDLDNVLDYISDHARNTVEKGDLWVRVTTWYLRNDPEMQQVVGRVWRWEDSDNPLNENHVHDNGIDLVAERKDVPDSYWAIQCKNYDLGHKMGFGELSTFFASAQIDPRYTGLIVMTAGDELSKTANERALALKHNRGLDTLVIGPCKMREANVDWSLMLRNRIESKEARYARTYSLRWHQARAVNGIQSAFETHDRCKEVMACGTGKTLMSLRLAEKRFEDGCGNLVLFCAPSIALVSQSMREWTNQARVKLRSLVVCSDTKASEVDGNDDILDNVVDLGFPSTTDPQKLLANYERIMKTDSDAMVVVFSTYQSMQVVQDAQDLGLPRFGLCVCDEAHRTAGTKYAEGDDVSSFQIVLDGGRIRADKRLFMTATPKIYGENAKTKAGEQAVELYSMDDEAQYGPLADELTFYEAVEKNLLCDYRVVVLAINEDLDGKRIIVPQASDQSELEVGDAAKIIGCWKGLATHGDAAAHRLREYDPGSGTAENPNFLLIDDIADSEAPDAADIEPLHRAVGFCSNIRASKNIDRFFEQTVDEYMEQTGGKNPLKCKLEHVDGKMDSRERGKKLRWLASGTDEGECRILTNARCLSEGVDVPSLDAVIFFSPKRSKIDVVQAVGRVMRKFTDKRTGKEKKLGYIILPVVIPSGMTAADALNQSSTFDVVWEVLRALRSHDQRIDAYINSLSMRSTRRGEKELGIGRGSGPSDDRPEPKGDDRAQTEIEFDYGTTPLEKAIYAKTVEKCGNKVYWSNWAEDVGRIAQRHIDQINDAIENDAVAAGAMDSFLQSLRDSLNPGITRQAAVEMVAQHLVTLPVFDALFGDDTFAGNNPVSKAITRFLNILEGHGIGELDEVDRRSLEELYSSVRRRASFCRTDGNRQSLIKDLYNDFFKKAFTRTAEKLGIAYTPIEIVDYMLHAADRCLRREFGRGLADEGVHILDPFAGTGTYMAELVSDPELIPVGDLPRKYKTELHSNEILLLAYYIMVVNIEYAYHARVGGDYVPFDGGILTDTFQMDEEGDRIDLGIFAGNTERVEKQRRTPITVVIGNPPYSAGQKSANDDNANEHYVTLSQRIAESYAANSDAKLKNSLYDSYIEAFRWASDRVEDQGVVCFVTNAGWLRSEAGAGVRRCFVKEFNSIYVFDLLGNQRTSGGESRRQGGKVFGSDSRAPIAITMLVKNPVSAEHGAIHYFSVDEYMSAQDKLSMVASYIDREPKWEMLTQDRHGDWLDKRDDAWYEFAPVGVWDGNKKTSFGMFATWSRGLTTSRDSWMIGFSPTKVVDNMDRMIGNYNSQVRAFQTDADSFRIDRRKDFIAWTDGLENSLMKGRFIEPSHSVRSICYRPFVKEWLYVADFPLVHRPYLQPSIFPLIRPNETAPNIVIDVGERGTIISDVLPDLELNHHGQCFPLYWYEKEDPSKSKLIPDEGEKVIHDAWGDRYVRHEAITDQTLQVFRDAYPYAFATRPKTKGGAGVRKEDIFWYVYGILHSPEYRTRFKANLQKELPRIPLADDFERFCNAGRALGDLHLHYEDVEQWPGVLVEGVLPGMDPGPVKKLAWAKKRNHETGKLEKDYTRIVYNKRVTVTGIPESSQDYVVNGRSPLDWMIDRYQVKTDTKTQITNDPNDYSDDPCYILELIGKLVTVSMRTNEIVGNLPPMHEIARPASWPSAWRTE